MAIPTLNDVKATMTARASALGFVTGKSGVADFFAGYISDIVAQAIYDRAAKLLDDAKQVVYTSDNLHPRTIVNQQSISCATGTTVFGPYSRSSSLDRLCLFYWVDSNTAGLGISNDLSSGSDIIIWIRRTANANEFEVVVINNEAAAKDVEFAVVALRFA